MGFGYAEYRLPGGLTGFEPVTICFQHCFQHCFKMPRELWGGSEWNTTVLDPDLSLHLLKQEQLQLATASFREMARSVSLQRHCCWTFGVLDGTGFFCDMVLSTYLSIYSMAIKPAGTTTKRPPDTLTSTLGYLDELHPARLLRSRVFRGKPHHPPNPPWHRDELHQPPANPPVHGVHGIPVGFQLARLNMARWNKAIKKKTLMVPWVQKSAPPPVLLRPPLPWSLLLSGRWCNQEACCWGLGAPSWGPVCGHRWGHGYWNIQEPMELGIS